MKFLNSLDWTTKLFLSKYEIHSLQMVCEGMFNRVGAVKKLIKLLLKQKCDIIAMVLLI